MTMPDERFRAVITASNLLHDLLDPKKTPRVPKQVRERARGVLRHYPSYWDLDRVSKVAPDVFLPRMEEVTKMFKQYELSKANKHED